MGYSKEVEEVLFEGSKFFGAKQYDLASEKYGEACEMVNLATGEDDPDLLFLYGKSLFLSGVSNSEVFGGVSNKDNGADKEGDDENEEDESNEGNFQFNEEVAEEEGIDDLPQAAGEEDNDDNNNDDDNSKNELNESKGESRKGEEEEEEEEQSDFEAAWEILDLTRTIFEKRLQSLSAEGLSEPYLKNSQEQSDNEYINITKKLSETYDLLGEVSLESENFTQSAIDLERSLELRSKLYPESSPLISESHYKLSLALEFCVEDPKSKLNAISHLKKAIELVQQRNVTETDSKIKKDNDELVQDLKVKLDELEKEELPGLNEQKMDILKGILGQPSESVVNDLSAMVKKSNVKNTPNDLTSLIKKRPSSTKKTDSIKKAKK